MVDNISIKGYSHNLIDKECQDSSISWQRVDYDASIICDGHGGDKHFRSAIGARFACEIGKKQISSFMYTLQERPDLSKMFEKNKKKREEMLKQLECSIICEWNEKVKKHLVNNPLEDDERYKLLSENDRQSVMRGEVKAYGTTFIALICTKKFFFVLKLGDGNICVFDKNNNVVLFDKMCKELQDDRLQFNISTSLCNNDASFSFRHYFKRVQDITILQGLISTSDGVINSYSQDSSYELLLKDILNEYRLTTKAKAHEELGNFLLLLSERGSGDDLSVAIICRKQQYDKR